MKKIIFCTAIMLCMLVSVVNAQVQSDATLSSSKVDTTQVVITEEEGIIIPPSSFWDNWFVGAGVGANIYLGESDRRGPLGNRLSFVMDISLGKWVTPDVGFRLQFNGFNTRGHIAEDYANQTVSSEELINGGWYMQKWRYNHLHGDALFNLSNMLGGYEEDRFYSIILYAGLGFIRSGTTEDNTEITANLGIVNEFRLTEALALTLEVRTTLVHDRFDTEEQSYKNLFFEGMANVSAGLTYRFNPRGWDRPYTITKYIENNRYYLLPPVIIEKKVVEYVHSPIFFDLNKSKIINREKMKVEAIAKTINSSEDGKVFTIVGSADKQTGNPRINHRLSKSRAEAVFNMLVNEFGVNPAKLKIEYRGGVDYMFYNDNELSRAVIFE